MADLTKIFGGKWTPPIERTPDAPEIQLHNAIIDAGMTAPDSIVLDGRIHRFRSGTKGTKGAGDKTGWYIAFCDGVPAGRFGCWRAGIESRWVADVGRSLTASEQMAHALRMDEAKRARDEERARSREIAADVVEVIWSAAPEASPQHPYLLKKGIQPHGARITGDGRLVVPIFGADGDLQSLQYISHDGQKLYHAGGQTGGAFWSIGSFDDCKKIFIAEGFATAATIHEHTGQPCVVAYSASNLVPVTASIRERFGAQADLVIVADNDLSGTGQKYADQASAKYGARVVMPPIAGMDANDYRAAGHDLGALLSPPLDHGWLIPADDFSAQPAPISWLVKNWLQDNALIMVHGQSGGGKTFVVLDWCLRMASGMADWHGHRVKSAPVVYLAGEGHHGLRGRIAAWKQHHAADRLNMWLSRDGCDLNTPDGYRRVVDSIGALHAAPRLIVVDTLHRFLMGDENSAVDAKTMLDACAGLMREFNCSVLLVHHTGVAAESQHRARGSSAWRGALDIEIGITAATESSPIEITQRKSKDAEISAPKFVALDAVTISGWVDEDGEEVTSAVVVAADAPEKSKKESPIVADIRRLNNAWFHSGAEIIRDNPYISRSGLIDHLIVNEGITELTAQKYVQPSANGRMINNLLTSQIIKPEAHGWAVIDQATAASFLLMIGQKP